MKYMFCAVVIIFLMASCTSRKDKAAQFLKSGKDKMYGGNFSGALADLDQAVELDPELLQAWYYRANLKHSMNDFDGALSDYTKCIEMNPSFADAYCNRGSVKFAKGDRDAACSDWRKAGELGKENIKDKLLNCP